MMIGELMHWMHSCESGRRWNRVGGDGRMVAVSVAGYGRASIRRGIVFIVHAGVWKGVCGEDCVVVLGLVAVEG